MKSLKYSVLIGFTSSVIAIAFRARLSQMGASGWMLRVSERRLRPLSQSRR